MTLNGAMACYDHSVAFFAEKVCFGEYHFKLAEAFVLTFGQHFSVMTKAFGYTIIHYIMGDNRCRFNDEFFDYKCRIATFFYIFRMHFVELLFV